MTCTAVTSPTLLVQKLGPSSLLFTAGFK